MAMLDTSLSFGHETLRMLMSKVGAEEVGMVSAIVMVMM